MQGSTNAQNVQKIDTPSTIILGHGSDYAIEANTPTNLQLDSTLYSHGDNIIEKVSSTRVKVLKAGYYHIHASIYGGQWGSGEANYGTSIITSKRTSAIQFTAPSTSVTYIRNLQNALDIYLDENDTIDFGFIAEAKVTITTDKTGQYWGKTGTHLQITYLGGGVKDIPCALLRQEVCA